MRRKADWLAWFLQFIAGLMGGFLLGLAVLGSRRFKSSYWLESELVAAFLIGLALVGAGLASWHGDRLWLGGSVRMIRPDGVAHSKASRFTSFAVVALGGLVVVAVILLHLHS